MKKYKVILADPPWEYRDTATYKNFRPNGMGAIHHYNTMPIDDIYDLKVPSDKDCILFLWVTTPFLPEGIETLKRWGFQYKTAIYWDKINLGTGHWFRGQVEVLLVGIKGEVKAFHSQLRNIIKHKYGKHSRKPPQVYTIIESININPKVELFARTRRQGWDVWGNEAPNQTQALLSQSRIIGIKRKNSGFSPNPKSKILDFA